MQSIFLFLIKHFVLSVFLAELINAARELDQRFVNDRDVRFSDKEFDSYEQLKNYVDRKIDEYKSQAKKNKSDMDRMLFVFILGENSDQLYSKSTSNILTFSHFRLK